MIWRPGESTKVLPPSPPILKAFVNSLYGHFGALKIFAPGAHASTPPTLRHGSASIIMIWPTFDRRIYSLGEDYTCRRYNSYVRETDENDLAGRKIASLRRMARTAASPCSACTVVFILLSNRAYDLNVYVDRIRRIRYDRILYFTVLLFSSGAATTSGARGRWLPVDYNFSFFLNTRVIRYKRVGRIDDNKRNIFKLPRGIWKPYQVATVLSYFGVYNL